MSLLSSLPPMPPFHRLPSPPLPYRARVAQHFLKMRMLDVLAVVLPLDEPRLFVGNGSSLALCRAIAAQGHRRVLLVTDSGLTGLGLYDDHVTQLEEVGVDVHVYDGVNPNPTEQEMETGMAVARDAGGVDAVLAVGGGSPMDAAKVIAAGLANDMRVAAMEGVLRIRRDPLPIYTIPTTAGTGSEATIGAIVTKTSERRKYTVADPRFIATAAALDPTLMAGLPPAITAATGMDALTHAIEASISRRADEGILAAGRTATRMIFANLRTAHADGSDLAAREAMALASFEAGTAICRAATGYVHAIAHQLGGHYGTPHGVANATLLPHVLRASRPEADAVLADLAVVADLATPRESVTTRADRFIAAVDQLREDVALPAELKEVEDSDVPTIAARAMQETFELNDVPKLLRQRDLEAVVRDIAVA